MFRLVRDMIRQEGLPEGLVARCLDVLKVLSPSERLGDLMRIVVEVVRGLRDEREGQDEERGGEKEGEERGRRVQVPSRCPNLQRNSRLKF